MATDKATMILPPAEIQTIVQKTAQFLAKNSNPALENKLREREKTDSRFAFMNATDPYHAYYLDRLEAYKAGTADAAPGAAAGAAPAAAGGAAAKEDKAAVEKEEDKAPKQPPPYEFLIEDAPGINAVDLDIIRLTALFTARTGRQFSSSLAARESRNYQFDFLRPTHSLFGYFNRLVEQYTKILIPSKESTAALLERAGGKDKDEAAAKRKVLEDARERVVYEKWDASRRQAEEDREEADRIAFAEIDWHDFQVVSTVEFTEADEAGLVDLPPPMSINEVENMTIAQKKMAAMIMEGRDDEVAELEREAQAAEMEFELDEVDEAPAATTNANGDIITPASTSGAVKIRKDYVPKAKRLAEAQKGPAMTMVNGQLVPVDQFGEHMRIELLDPRWKEQKRQNEANRSASNLLPGGTDVGASLRAMAAHRADIFGTSADDEARQKLEAERIAKQRERERGVWDGHTNTSERITERYLNNANYDEQIAAIHRAKGLIPSDDAGAGPRIGPSAGPGAEAAAAPQGPTTLISGSSISAGPMPLASSSGPPPPQPPPMMFSGPPGIPPPPGGFPYPPPGGFQGLPAGVPVSQPVSAPPPASAPEVPSAGTVRPAEDGAGGEPDSKKQRLSKAAEALLTEEQWLESHPNPITVLVQLPTQPDKPEWGCDGTVLTLEEIPLSLLVSTLRDRIQARIGLPVGKQKFEFKGQVLRMQSTLAELNVDEGDTLLMSVKEDAKRKRK